MYTYGYTLLGLAQTAPRPLLSGPINVKAPTRRRALGVREKDASKYHRSTTAASKIKNALQTRAFVQWAILGSNQ
jgi:hypothetical protein